MLITRYSINNSADNNINSNINISISNINNNKGDSNMMTKFCKLGLFDYAKIGCAL